MKDSTGREIKVGDVISHCVRTGSHLHFNTGVVRRIPEAGTSLVWQAIREVLAEPNEQINHWHLVNAWGKETMIWHTEYSTITGMKEEDLKELFGL